MKLKQEEIDRKFMRMAFIQSEFSYAIRLKVGSIIVKNGRILGNGCNAMPIGDTYCCEYEIDGRDEPCKSSEAEIIRLRRLPMDKIATKKEVVHSEIKSIKRCPIKSFLNGATIYVTHSPCKDCAEEIIKQGIKRVVYSIDYHSLDGVKKLLNAHVKVDKIEVCDF